MVPFELGALRESKTRREAGEQRREKTNHNLHARTGREKILEGLLQKGFAFPRFFLGCCVLWPVGPTVCSQGVLMGPIHLALAKGSHPGHKLPQSAAPSGPGWVPDPRGRLLQHLKLPHPAAPTSCLLKLEEAGGKPPAPACGCQIATTD